MLVWTSSWGVGCPVEGLHLLEGASKAGLGLGLGLGLCLCLEGGIQQAGLVGKALLHEQGEAGIGTL